ncbi:MAG TPA: glycosyltransferase [Solirubrobacteraceae bacterium]
MRVSVLMPVYEQEAFVPRALGGLLAQSVTDWELVVVDDGSPGRVAAAFPAGDPRIVHLAHPRNRGLGAALNTALDAARAPVVAYLPADDLWFADHLLDLLAALDADPGARLAHAALDIAGDDAGQPTPWLQLVQVAHRAGPERWTERPELETDDLDRLLWRRLPGRRVATGRATCRWTAHPGQRHRALRESCDGGLNVFRRRYGVAEPLRLHASDGAPVDEVARYARFRRAAPPAPEPGGLTILLVGELAYNPERVLALAERGHRLLGLWTPDGLGFNTVGPLPFPGVEDLDAADWRAAIRAARPDVIYALLNWRAVPFAHAVLAAGTGVPFVWHFKEAPQRSLVRGEWPLLARLCAGADACILASPAERDFMLAALPGRLDPERTHVLDGDLPKRDWFDAPRAPKLSAGDGAPHVAVLGRPAGLAPEDLARLAAAGVHHHLHGVPGGWARAAAAAAPGRVHPEAPVDPADWVGVLSRYDAGWLHPVRSANGGDIRRATWDDLNLPARLPTLVGAGLPPIGRANPGHRVAVEEALDALGTGLRYEEIDDLPELLRAEVASGQRGAAAWAGRDELTFDRHADRLVAILGAAADSRA